MVLPLNNIQNEFEKKPLIFAGASGQGMRAESNFYAANKSGFDTPLILGGGHNEGYFVCMPYGITPDSSAKKTTTSQYGVRSVTVNGVPHPVIEAAVVEFVPRRICVRKKTIGPTQAGIRMRALRGKQNRRPVALPRSAKRKSPRRLYDVYINGCRVAVRRLGAKAQKILANGIFAMTYDMSATYTINQNSGLKKTNIPQSIRKFCMACLASRQFKLGANHR
ncbi:MAG: hypothetical protein R8N50_01385 [Alphaproteobacteria bacterium]|nr:hypothetical protein [Alphaproteobacteria bacterium]